MYIKRDLENQINRYLSFKEIIAIIGPRQSGKTTIINKCLDEIKDKKILKISFEDISILRLFEEDIKAFIELYIKNYDIVFIDEIQYSKNNGQKLKFIYDTLKTKLIISGSSTPESSISSIKFLVGRIFIFELYTLSFEEFLRFKNNKLYNLYEKNLIDSSALIDDLNRFWDEYMIYGGYPRVVIMKSKKDKIEILKNIYNTYLLKEITEILQFKENYKISSLIQNLAIQVGGIINYNDLCTKTNMNNYELKNALSILEKTYICKFAKPFYTNKQLELIKNPKVFFFDMGFRNIVLNRFEKLIEGFMIENFVSSELIRNGMEVKYWRTKSKAEVDFIIESKGKIIPVETKSKLNNNVIEKSFRSFIDKYKPTTGYILSRNFNDKRRINNCSITFLPYNKFNTILKKL